MPASREASRVFPVPGGPLNSREWLPAAAISKARRGRSWRRGGCAFQPAKQHHVVVGGVVEGGWNLGIEQVGDVQIQQRRAAQLLQQALHGGQLALQLGALARQPVKAAGGGWRR